MRLTTSLAALAIALAPLATHAADKKKDEEAAAAPAPVPAPNVSVTKHNQPKISSNDFVNIIRSHLWIVLKQMRDNRITHFKSHSFSCSFTIIRKP